MLDRPHWKLTLLGLGVVSACSFTVPSEDDVFGGSGSAGSSSAGTANDSGGPGSGTAGSMPAANGGGGLGAEGGQPASSTAGSGQDAAGMPAMDEGGAGGAPGTTPKPTGEIVNPSFEGASLKGWTISPPSKAVYPQASGAVNGLVAPDGDYVLSTYDGKNPYTVKIFQMVEGLEDGVYRLAVFSANKVSIPRANLYATNCGGAEPTPVALSGSGQELVEVAIEGIEVVGGKCEIGLDIDAVAQDWINVDAFSLKRVPPK